MESNTEPRIIVDFGSLLARFQTLSDKRKDKGMRYSLAMILVVVMMAKLCGENHIMGIENGLHYRGDVTLREDYTRITKGRAGQVMACLNYLIIGILLSKKKHRTIPAARRFFCAHPEEAFALIARL